MKKAKKVIREYVYEVKDICPWCRGWGCSTCRQSGDAHFSKNNRYVTRKRITKTYEVDVELFYGKGQLGVLNNAKAN